MRRINTLAELKAEQKALKIKKAMLEAEIKKDFAEIKEDLEPLRLLTKGAKQVLSSKNNGILGGSAGMIADFITKNALLRNSGFLARFILPHLAKNVTSNYVEDNKSQITDWIGNLISKFTRKKTTVDTNITNA